MKKSYTFLRFMTIAILILLLSGAHSQTNPVAVDDYASIKKYHREWLNILENDYDPDGDTLIIMDFGDPLYGTIFGSNDSSLRYRCIDWVGEDSLWYTITKKNNPEYSANAWLHITVLPNELPYLNSDPIDIISGDTLTICIYDIAEDQEGDDFELDRARDPEHGEANESSDTTFWVTITHNYLGDDSLRIELVELSSGYQSQQYLKLDVSPNTEYPWANNDTMTVMRGDTAVLYVLENDTDQQNDQLIIDDVDKEYYKPIIYFGNNENTVTIVPDVFADTGLFRYFEYQAVEQENTLHLSNWASGYLHVLPNPNLPVAINDTATVEAGFEVQIHPLANDTDINGDPLKISEVWTAYHNVIFEYNDSVVTVTPYAYTHGQVELLYRLEETGNAAHYDEGKIILYITDNQNPPIAVNDTIYMNAYDSISFNPIDNDYLPLAGDVSIFEIENTGLNPWSVTIEKNPTDESTINLDLKSNYAGEFTFRYKFQYIDMPGMVSNFGTVSIVVEPDPDSLLAIGDEVETNFLFPIEDFNILANDYIASSDTIEEIFYSSHPDLLSGGYNTGLFQVQPDDFIHGTYYLYYYLFKDYPPVSNPAPQSFARIKVQVNNLHRTDALDINNIHAGFSAYGQHFWDFQTENQFLKFEVPKGSGKHSIFSNALWIGGLHNDTLHLAAEQYRQYGADFFAGPVSETYTNTDKQKYRVWKIQKSEIDYHITHYSDPGYEPVEAIATWPGNGNSEMGQAEQLAPYFDQNSDGVYDPLDGDFPLIRGDQSLFFIYNDGEQYHSETEGQPLEIEIHANAYAFDNPNDSADFNTIYVHYDIHNRSENLYENTYVGIFNDFDLGYAWDDYIGSDVSRGVAYVYNGNDVDGYGELYAYGENPPVQAMVILGGATMDDDNLDNPAGGCDESINGINFGDGIVDNERLGMTGFSYLGGNFAYPHPNDPQTAIEYYNFMIGTWKDNSPLLYGGSGHINNPQTVGPECKFAYPGASDPLNWGTNCEFPNGGFNQNGYYWDELTAENSPGDRATVSISGPFTFEPGEKQSLDLAFVYARDFNPNDDKLAIDIMNERIDTLHARVSRGQIINLPSYSVGIVEPRLAQTQFSLFPNPANGDFVRVDLRETAGKSGVHFEILDVTGRVIQSGGLPSGVLPSINISGIRPGVYLISISQGSVRSVKKLIIR